MLRHTFCHLPGVGPKVEEKLWHAGVESWDVFLDECAGQPRYPARKSWARRIEESQRHFDQGNAGWFTEHLPNNQTWRLFKDYRHSCAFLDIETTGLGGYGDHLTTVALYDGNCIRCYVHGVNLDDFPRDVQDYKLLVTYNGASFDLPFLERQFGMSFRHAHIDLRYVLYSLGIKGGLKQCEKQLGIDRPGLDNVDGYAAVLFWREYCRKREARALETLLAYNVQDTVNLEVLMIAAFNQKLSRTPFAARYRLPAAPVVENPYNPDAKLIAKVLRGAGWRMPLAT